MNCFKKHLLSTIYYNYNKYQWLLCVLLVILVLLQNFCFYRWDIPQMLRLVKNEQD